MIKVEMIISFVISGGQDNVTGASSYNHMTGKVCKIYSINKSVLKIDLFYPTFQPSQIDSINT